MREGSWEGVLEETIEQSQTSEPQDPLSSWDGRQSPAAVVFGIGEGPPI